MAEIPRIETKDLMIARLIGLKLLEDDFPDDIGDGRAYALAFGGGLGDGYSFEYGGREGNGQGYGYGDCYGDGYGHGHFKFRK